MICVITNKKNGTAVRKSINEIRSIMGQRNSDAPVIAAYASRFLAALMTRPGHFEGPKYAVDIVADTDGLDARPNFDAPDGAPLFIGA